MRRILSIGLLGLVASGAMAYDFPDNVTYKPICLSLGISPNGKWMGNYVGYAKIYDIENDVMTEYRDCTLSQGSPVTNNGIAAAGGVFLKDGEVIPVQTVDGQGGFDIESITSDAKYVTGSWRRGPFVGELDENLNIINPVSLPRPDTDLFGARPQWINSILVSENGNVCVGQIQDSYGMYLYPIIYYNTDEGWKYTIPIESLFNPTGAEIMQNPMDHHPEYPYPEDYMNPVEAEAYQEAYKKYVSEGNGIKPDPQKYMTEDQYAEYLAAVDVYNEWFYNSQEAFQKYLDTYYGIVETSPSFSQGELAIHPSGEYIYMNGGILDSDGYRRSYMYEFTTEGVNRLIPLRDNNQAPMGVLSDGTVLSSPPQMAGFNGFILEPGADEFITLSEYISRENPELAVWVEETFPGGTGTLAMSDDKSVIACSVFVTQLCDELYEVSDFRFATYIINMNEAGVESLVAEPTDGVYKVYNLQGVKVLETKDASAINYLPKGLYIVNGKKIMK